MKLIKSYKIGPRTMYKNYQAYRKGRAIVTKDLPPHYLIGGVPVKIIKENIARVI